MKVSKFDLVFKSEKERLKKFSQGKEFMDASTKFILGNPDYGEESIRTVIIPNIKNIVSSINDDHNMQKILLLGEVQSGKTNNLIFLIAALKDMGFHKFIIFTGITKNLNVQNSSRISSEVSVATKPRDFSYYKDFFKSDDSDEILYGIKQNISNLIKLFESVTDYEMLKNKIVIIDDECDEASAKNDAQDRRINSSIHELIAYKTKKTLYIPITATPYKNLLLYGDQLSPEKVIPLISSSDYCGLKVFNDNCKYFSLKKEVIEFLRDINDSWNKELDEQVEKEITSLIASFIGKCVSLKENFQFIVNVSNDTKKILYLCKMFELIIWNIRDFTEEEILKYVNKNDTDEFKKKANSINICKNDQKNKYEEDKDKPEIIIGGKLLSRGVTYERLLYSIMLNHPEKINIGPFLQKARWFGYRKKYLEDIAVYTSNEAKEALKCAEKINDELFLKYRLDNVHNGNKVESIKEMFNEFANIDWK